MTLPSLFDQDSGFLEKDVVSFSAEVLILKETSVIQDLTDQDCEPGNTLPLSENVGRRSSFTW